ncbi:MAG: ABC transporter permease, partial [Gemmatimonadales bacterium]
MRFGEVFRFEVGYRLRQVSTWIYAGILLGLAFFFVHEDAGDSASALYTNAPGSIAEFSIFIGLIGMMVTAAIFGDVATRDVRTGMHPLVHTTPLRKAEYLGGQFLGAFVVNALVLMVVPLGIAIATQMPYLDPGVFGPFQAAAYVQPYLLFLLPNLVLSGVVLFAIAALTRHTLPAYLGGLGLFFGYLISTGYRDYIPDPTLAALSDPIGLEALRELTRYWTVAERNTQLIGFPDMLLWNRVVWTLVAVGVLGLLHTRFRFGHAVEGGRSRRGRRRITEPGAARHSSVALPRVTGVFDFSTHVRQTLAVARLSLREVARSKALLAIMAWTVVIV